MATPAVRGPADCLSTKEVAGVTVWLAEEDGFELPVPRKVDDAFETAIFASGHLPFAGRLIREVRIRFPPPGSILISPDFPTLRRAIRLA